MSAISSVRPAFDLGEAAKVVILSVTEGEDKPLKYPDMFAAAELMILNKTDLLPHLSFDVERCVGYARKVNPSIAVLQLSANTGEGLGAWYRWIDDKRGKALADRVAALEAKLAGVRSRLCLRLKEDLSMCLALPALVKEMLPERRGHGRVGRGDQGDLARPGRGRRRRRLCHRPCRLCPVEARSREAAKTLAMFAEMAAAVQ